MLVDNHITMGQACTAVDTVPLLRQSRTVANIMISILQMRKLGTKEPSALPRVTQVGSDTAGVQVWTASWTPKLTSARQGPQTHLPPDDATSWSCQRPLSSLPVHLLFPLPGVLSLKRSPPPGSLPTFHQHSPTSL